MKRALTTLFVFSTILTFAQQEPYYTHFKYNPMAYNPAAAGEHTNFLCLSGISHYQWRQFSDVTTERGSDGIPGTSVDNIAPETQNINVSTLFSVGKVGNQFAGVGVSFINDQVGFTARTSAIVNLNYKMNLNDGNSQVAAGIGLGFMQFGLKNANYKFRDPNDPLIPQGNGSQSKFNLSAGAVYHAKRMGPFRDFNVGFSVTQLNAGDYKFTVQPTGNFHRKFVPHYWTLINADYDMGNITLEPALLFKYALIGAEYKPQFDVNCTALFARTFRGGLGYRQWANADALSLLIGYTRDYGARGILTIGYSYDITMSQIQTVSNGTHEVMLKYCLPFVVVAVPEIPIKGVRDL